MFRSAIRGFATAAESASKYGIKVGKVQGKVNGFVGGASPHCPTARFFTRLLPSCDEIEFPMLMRRRQRSETLLSSV